MRYQENRCRAGRSVCCGAPTVNRCGVIEAVGRSVVRSIPQPACGGSDVAGGARRHRRTLGPAAWIASGPRGSTRNWLGAAVRLPAGDGVRRRRSGRRTARHARKAAGRLDAAVTEPRAYVLPLHPCTAEDGTGWASADWRCCGAADRAAGRRFPGRSAAAAELDQLAAAAPDCPRGDPLGRQGDFRHRGREPGGSITPDAPTTAMVAEMQRRRGFCTSSCRPLRRPTTSWTFRRLESAVAAHLGCPGDHRGLRPARRRAPAVHDDHPGPGCHRGQRRTWPVSPNSVRNWRSSTNRPGWPSSVHRVVRRGRHHGGTGGGNRTSRWADHPSRLATAAPAGPAGLAADVLAAASGVVVPVLRAGSSGPPRRHRAWTRGRAERSMNWRSRSPRSPLSEAKASAVGHRPAPAAPADRHHRQHPPRRVLHRQALQPRQQPRPAWLLELRGFEMPPHYQMAMVQSLLVRSLVAWFWEEPLRAPLIRHGANCMADICCRTFLIHDIADVRGRPACARRRLRDQLAGPVHRVPVPRIGTAVFDGVELELRGAIEPWNVLGEEVDGRRHRRYVDSSVERIRSG